MTRRLTPLSRQLSRLATLLGATALYACTAATPTTPNPSTSPSSPAIPNPSATPTTPTTPAAPMVTALDPAAIEAALATPAYVRINTEPKAATSAHSGRLILYVDKAHADSYKKGFTGKMAAGATVVKVSDKPGEMLAIMVKQPAGTATAAEDWLYWERLNGRIVFDGTQDRTGGFCYSCHKSGQTTDGLLGLNVFPN
jgi:hypothetical protein